MELVVFYSFAGLAILSALFILFSKNLIYSAFALFIAFLGVSALYVFAGADFLAVTQIMIYVGGILVLLMFGIMLTQKSTYKTISTSPNQVIVLMKREFWGLLIGVGLFSFLTYVIIGANFTLVDHQITNKSTIPQIGFGLMTSHLLPFEIAAILLLLALVGAAYLALNRNPVSK
jgi:NADH:ubiquinone oxidoreductase subunit 6 (subunit J)